MTMSKDDNSCNGEAHDRNGNENNQQDKEIIHEKNNSEYILPRVLNVAQAAERGVNPLFGGFSVYRLLAA